MQGAARSASWSAGLTSCFCIVLKWRFQPELRSRSWEVSIANARGELTDHLADNPRLNDYQKNPLWERRFSATI